MGIALESSDNDGHSKPDLEEELAARANVKGLSTEEFVNRVLERLVAQEKPVTELSAEERARILEE